jgi:hypothetical protein
MHLMSTFLNCFARFVSFLLLPRLLLLCVRCAAALRLCIVVREPLEPNDAQKVRNNWVSKSRVNVMWGNRKGDRRAKSARTSENSKVGV